MKNLTRKGCILLCTVLCCLFSTISYSQQSLTQINGWNAYVHLPANYNSSSANYPTIIFFPGLGEVGTNAAALISNGPGAYIAQGWNGNVSVDGNTVEFIVISIQPPSAYPGESSINDKIQKIKSLYRVDNNRLYLTGLSHGGWCSNTFVTGDAYGGPYNYASQIAAVVEVQGVIPDDNAPYPNLFDNFANSGGRLLGFEQRLDNRGMPTRINRMNATKANSGIYVQTNFGGGGHCCWNQFYGGQGVQPGNFMLDGVNQNLYQWLARQSRGGTGTPAPPANMAPVSNAGADKTITLPTSSVTVSGSGTDADGTIASYQWSKVSGNAGTIVSGNAASTNITGLTQGSYTFQLKVTDNKGATATDNVVVTVNAAVVSLLPAVNPANTVNGLDYKYYEGSWSALPNFASLTPVKTGTVNNFDISVANRTNQIGFSFTGYVTVPADGVYTFYTTSDDGSRLLIDNVLVVDNDGLHAAQEKSGTIGLKAGKHAITGLFFEQGGGEIFTVSFGGNGLSKQIIPASSLFRVSISNNIPVANAGANQNITTASAILSGSGTDTDGTITGYQWTKVSGQGQVSFSNENAASTSVSGLTQGTYLFQLKVTDNAGATATATTQLVVTAGSPAGKAIRVNLFGGSNAYNDNKWNNWNINTGVNSSNFLYEDRTASTVKASLAGDVMVVDNGTGYANGATTPASTVLRYNSASTSQRNLTLKGLNPAKKYTLEFYASRKATGNKTLYIIGNKKDTINTDNNSNDYALFTDISADAGGNVTVNISRIGVWNYLAGFSIMEQDGSVAGKGIEPETATGQSPVGQVYKGEDIVEMNSISVAVYPNPFQDFFKVQLNNRTGGEFILKLTSQAGQTVYYKKVNKAGASVVETISVQQLAPGTYVLQIISVATGNITIHKVIKN